MAITKMSEFTALVLNEHVDELLYKLQLYRNVTFQDLQQEDDYFKKKESDYDFEHNLFVQDRLKEILNSLDAFEKKHLGRQKGSFLKKLNVPSLAFNELNERCQNIDIDALLDTFDQYHDTAKVLVEGYELYKPWKKKRIDAKAIAAFGQPKAISGTLEESQSLAFQQDIKRCGDVFIMHRPLSSEQRIFVLLPAKDCLEQIDIVMDKYHFEHRTASSLGIGEDVARMIEQIKSRLERYSGIEEQLAQISNFKDEIKMYYEFLKNKELRNQTKLFFLCSDSVTKISGWIFTDDKEQFSRLVKEVTGDTYVCEIIDAPLDSKEVPVQLQNNKITQAFESITNMYSLPRYHEVDPTSLLAPFYSIFFGMMLGDVGYGILLGIATFLAGKFLNLKESTANFVRFLMYLSIPTTLCGWAYGSFFGGMIPIKGIIDINQDFMQLLVFALCFGIVHLFFGLGIKAYMYFRIGKPLYALFDVGFWYMTLIGAIVLVSQMFTDLLAPYTEPGQILMIVGMIGIITTNGREAKTIVGKSASGFYSLYGLSNYIGDVLSYSRLMALGLAGASIGVAFNMIGQMLGGLGIFGAIAGAVVFAIGHTFNMAISGLSAYVHSARLTYVEFFGKFYTGGGRKFQAFRSKNTYINLQ